MRISICLLVLCATLAPRPAHAHRLRLLDARLHLGALASDEAGEGDEDVDETWADLAATPPAPPWSAGHWVGTLLLADVAGFIGALAGGWAVLGVGAAAGIPDSTQQFALAIYGAAIAGATLTMAAVTYWMCTPTGARPSYWASVLGGLVGAGLAVALGISLDSVPMDIVLGAVLPALGAMLAGYWTREVIGAERPLGPPPGRDPRRYQAPDEEDEEEDARLDTGDPLQAEGRKPSSTAPSRVSAAPRTPVVTFLAMHF